MLCKTTTTSGSQENSSLLQEFQWLRPSAVSLHMPLRNRQQTRPECFDRGGVHRRALKQRSEHCSGSRVLPGTLLRLVANLFVALLADRSAKLSLRDHISDDAGVCAEPLPRAELSEPRPGSDKYVGVTKLWFSLIILLSKTAVFFLRRWRYYRAYSPLHYSRSAYSSPTPVLSAPQS